MYNRMLGLITEIGDTQEGKRRILKAYQNRKEQIAAADKSLEKNRKHPEATEQQDDWENDPDSPAGQNKVAITRAKIQAKRVDTYMRARAAGEAAGGALSPERKARLADVAAKQGLKVHKQDYGEAEAALKMLRRSAPEITPKYPEKRRSTRGSTGQGLEAAKFNADQRGRNQNYRNN